MNPKYLHALGAVWRAKRLRQYIVLSSAIWMMLLGSLSLTGVVGPALYEILLLCVGLVVSIVVISGLANWATGNPSARRRT